MLVRKEHSCFSDLLQNLQEKTSVELNIPDWFCFYDATTWDTEIKAPNIIGGVITFWAVTWLRLRCSAGISCCQLSLGRHTNHTLLLESNVIDCALSNHPKHEVLSNHFGQLFCAYFKRIYMIYKELLVKVSWKT